MILVDTSIWIDFFKGNSEVILLNDMIDNNTICINDLILSELIPSINHKKEFKLKELLFSITRIPLNINWQDLIALQTLNLKNGINKVGLPDLIIAQNSLANNLEIFTNDSHFDLMSPIHGIKIFKK